MEERRVYSRARGDIEWLFVVQITSDEEVVITETKDISCSGMRCSLDRFFPKDKDVDVLLLLPLTEKGLIFEKVNCRARVVRCQLARKNDLEAYDIGFEFMELKEQDVKKIAQYVEHAHTFEVLD